MLPWGFVWQYKLHKTPRGEIILVSAEEQRMPLLCCNRRSARCQLAGSTNDIREQKTNDVQTTLCDVATKKQLCRGETAVDGHVFLFKWRYALDKCATLTRANLEPFSWRIDVSVSQVYRRVLWVNYGARWPLLTSSQRFSSLQLMMLAARLRPSRSVWFCPVCYVGFQMSPLLTHVAHADTRHTLLSTESSGKKIVCRLRQNVHWTELIYFKWLFTLLPNDVMKSNLLYLLMSLNFAEQTDMNVIVIIKPCRTGNRQAWRLKFSCSCHFSSLKTYRTVTPPIYFWTYAYFQHISHFATHTVSNNVVPAAAHNQTVAMLLFFLPQRFTWWKTDLVLIIKRMLFIQYNIPLLLMFL